MEMNLHEVWIEYFIIECLFANFLLHDIYL